MPAGKSNFLDALQLLSRIATSETLNDAFKSPYRGTPLESFTFGKDGVQGLMTKESIAFSIEVDVELSQNIIDIVNQRIQSAENIKVTGEKNNSIKESPLSPVREKNLHYRIEVEIFPRTGSLQIADEVLSVITPVNDQPEWIGPLVWHGKSTLETASILSPSYFSRYLPASCPMEHYEF